MTWMPSITLLMTAGVLSGCLLPSIETSASGTSASTTIVPYFGFAISLRTDAMVWTWFSLASTHCWYGSKPSFLISRRWRPTVVVSTTGTWPCG